MTQAQEITKKVKDLEGEMAVMRRMVDFMMKHFNLQATPQDFIDAVAALTAGDPSKLDSYVARGGKIAENQ